MYWKYAPVFAAGLSSAFLLPPSISDEVAEAFQKVHDALAVKVNQAAAVVSPFHRTVELDCPNCPFYEGEIDGGYRVWTRTENSLIFNIDSDPSQPFTLTINNLDIFHPRYNKGLYAIQAPKNPEHLSLLNRIADPRVYLTYEIFVQTISPDVRHVRLHVLSIGGKFRTARDMDIIEMTVSRDARGIVHIDKVGTRAPTVNEASAAECKLNLVCQWKAYFADRVTAFKSGFGHRKPGCHGKNPFAVPAGGYRRPHHHHEEEHEHGEPHPHPPHHDHDHDHHHHHHHHGHTIFRAVFFLLQFIVLPISFGIVAGFAVSLIGVVVGHVVIMTYRMATGKPYSFSVCSQSCGSRDVKVAASEKEGLLDEKCDVLEEDDLPAYTDSEGVLRGEKEEL